MNSIRRRLLVVLLPAIAVAWLVSAVTSYFDSLHEQGEVFDAQLAQAARVLMLLTVHEIEENALVPNKSNKKALEEALHDERATQISHPYEHRLIFQVWLLPGRQLVLRSDKAPVGPLSNQSSGFTDTFIDKVLWRVYTVTNEDYHVRVSVAENWAGRERLAQIISFRVLIPLLVVIPILAMVVWFSVGRSLSPVKRLAHEIKRRKPSHLEPVKPDNAPAEIMPLVESLNTLLERVQRTLENERRFTADAAHELRTPLAGIKTQAQVALRDDNPQRKRQALQLLISAVDRTSHLVEQLLTLARLDPETGVTDPAPVRLGTVASGVVADLAPMALDKHIDISVADNCEQDVIANKDAVAILIRNLVDNALRYTPRGGIVEVLVEPRGENAVLSVADNGPGIPEEERAVVLERFTHSTRAVGIGSGLGLSIVRRIAQLHRAAINLQTSRHGGLEISVSFPLAPEQQHTTPRRRRPETGGALHQGA